MSRRVILLIVAVLVAAVGTSLVFVYVNTANDRALADQNPVQVLVAKNTIPAGTALHDAVAHGDLQLKKLPSAAVIQGALSDVTNMSDEVALSPVYAGQQIIAAEFGSATQASSSGLALSPGDIAISVQLADPNRVAGFVQPGSDVAVFLSGNMPGSSGTATRLLLPKVEVVAVGPTTVAPAQAGKANPESVPRALMTLAVSQHEAEQIITAQSGGSLWFGLLNGQSKVSPDSGVGTSQLFH